MTFAALTVECRCGNYLQQQAIFLVFFAGAFFATLLAAGAFFAGAFLAGASGCRLLLGHSNSSVRISKRASSDHSDHRSFSIVPTSHKL